MTWEIIQGDALSVLPTLPDQSVQCVVTSPPYFGLRDYGLEPLVWPAVSYHPLPGLPFELEYPGELDCDHVWNTELTKRNRWGLDDNLSDKQASNQGNAFEISQGNTCSKCGAWRGTLGLEPDPYLYVGHLVDIFREVRRVLRDDGTVFLNLGDSYGTGTSAPRQMSQTSHKISEAQHNAQVRHGGGAKQLLGMPFLVGKALQADGWYWRAPVIWWKRNGMPESVRDRPTTAHEYIWLLTKSERYYYDQDATREPHQPDSHNPDPNANPCRQSYEGVKALVYTEVGGKPQEVMGRRGWAEGGRNLRTVWDIPTKPYPGAHFAVFPPDIPKLCIQMGTSEWGECSVCGKPWERIKGQAEIKHTREPAHCHNNTPDKVDSTGWLPTRFWSHHFMPTCNCEAEPVGQTVLDPFAGSCTTLMVGSLLGRHVIGIEPNPNYVALGRERIIRAEGASTLEEAEELEGPTQLSLFGGVS